MTLQEERAKLRRYLAGYGPSTKLRRGGADRTVAEIASVRREIAALDEAIELHPGGTQVRQGRQ